MSATDSNPPQDPTANAVGSDALVRLLPAVSVRVETGPIQFGEDWPGTFIRGDHAGYYAMLLGDLLDQSEQSINNLQLRGLQRALAGCIQGPARAMCEPNAGPIHGAKDA